MKLPQLKLAVWTVGLVLLSVLCSRTFAISLGPGDSVLATEVLEPGIGSSLDHELVSLFSVSGDNSFSGTLTTRIYSNDPNNSNPDGLTFTFELSNDAISATSLRRITLEGWGGYSVDAGYVESIDPDRIAPLSMDRGSLNDGDVVGFDFGKYLSYGEGKLDPGERSEILVIRTDANYFASAEANIIDGSVVVTATFGPGTMVPDGGSSLLLLGTALLGLAAGVRFKFV